ncbi:MAG: phosphoribosylformylglycinamidine synthase, partial [Candidatus Woodwardiibium sp.]
MVNRIFVERKPAYANEARALCAEIRDFLGIAEIENVRIINRYDIEGVPADVLEKCTATVFAEPQVDDVLESLPQTDGAVFAAEYLPGQFDQRADSASQCVQFVSGGARPLVRSAKVYLLEGGLSAAQVEAVKKHVINPVDSREASFAKPDTLAAETAAPADVAQIEGFIAMDDDALVSLVDSLGLAMDADDLRFCCDYFRQERRDPTMTELRMIDTYWSDHCRHTTFSTVIDEVTVENDAVARAYDRYLKVRAELGRTKPVTLMDIATLAAKYLKRQGILKNLDESDEINACTVKIDVEIDGRTEPWLLLFKNETHNHPTEIEPFGGAATCIGGAIRDPLSGRAYVYQAMRITGSGDPLLPLSETMRGKLPQRKIAVSAAEGYSSYGNQI